MENAFADTVGFVLVVGARWTARSLPIALLNDVRQLVGQHDFSARGGGTIETLPENNIISDSKSTGITGSSSSIRLNIGVQPHVTEVLAKPRFHEFPRLWIERMTGHPNGICDRRRKNSTVNVGFHQRCHRVVA
jgi:hypothetical protein